MEVERPLDALNAARNQRVIVELKNKVQLVGKLKAFDIHINTVLDDAEERENGEASFLLWLLSIPFVQFV